MTTEEIEKAIERFTEERRHKSTGYPPKEWFKVGAEFADKYWQEKTRWIPVEERLPKVRKTPFFIAVKAHDNSDKFRANIETFLVKDESDVLWVGMNCKYWKEIEQL